MKLQGSIWAEDIKARSISFGHSSFTGDCLVCNVQNLIVKDKFQTATVTTGKHVDNFAQEKDSFRWRIAVKCRTEAYLPQVMLASLVE